MLERKRRFEKHERKGGRRHLHQRKEHQQKNCDDDNNDGENDQQVGNHEHQPMSSSSETPYTLGNASQAALTAEQICSISIKRNPDHCLSMNQSIRMLKRGIDVIGRAPQVNASLDPPFTPA